MLSSLRNRIALSKSKTSSSSSSSSSSNKETKPTKSKVTKSTTNRYKKNTTRINKENIQIKSINNTKKDQEEMKSSSPSLTTISSQQLTGSFDKLKLESQLVAGSLFQTNINANNKVESTTNNTPRFADECEYRMNHSKRGIALIINNKNFDPRLDMPRRDGTDQDAACLENTLIKLGFDIKLVHNSSVQSIRELVLKWSRADHTDMDCFVCVIMSHGEEGSIYGVDKSIDLDQIINPFKLNKTLAGKPKLFFIQACRGNKFMEGVDSNPFETQYVNKLPMEADFLFAYSTVSGYFSWRNSTNGSWFIQSLCEILSAYGNKLEIMQLLTMVNRKVAYYFESNTNDPSSSGKKQIPCIVSMLTKELYFKSKSIYSIQA